MFLASVVSEETTNLVQLITIIALAVLCLAMAVVCIANRKMNKNLNTKAIVYAAICIASSFVLSFIKISPVTYGGSITLASFVPILIYAYAFGPVRGLVAGFIYGILQFVQDPFMLTPLTFVLDYLLAFCTVALMGFAKHFTKSTLKNIIIGSVIVFVARFACHLVSGVLYFNMDAVWADLPMNNAFVYSFIYQCVYLPADAAISIIALSVLVSQKTFSRLLGMMVGGRKERAPVVSENPGTESK